ncbi:tripartite tricarboxylate transporter substrate binding protein [Alcaligenaceae bacterium]|nr:tripartite tricarboxylate transporter substrate binding protein [Alcaligenaceae bacterium]
MIYMKVNRGADCPNKGRTKNIFRHAVQRTGSHLRRTLWILSAFAGMAFVPGAASADFPDRPITLVVPYGPGSTIDGVARALGQGAQKRLGQSIVVENRSGAGGAIGAMHVGRQSPDGYTIGLVSNNPFVLSHFTKSMPLHPVEDFSHIITTAGYLMAVAVHANSEINSIQELVEAAKLEPGKLTYSTSGTASTGYLNMEEFAALAGIEVTHVPYKSGAEAVTALLSDQVNFYADAAWAPFARDGRLRPLLIFAGQRSNRYPDVPVPNDIVSANVQPGQLMLVAPKGVPEPVLQKLHDAFKATSNDAEYLAVTDRFNLEPLYLGPDATRDALAKTMAPLKKMFDTLGLGKQ